MAIRQRPKQRGVDCAEDRHRRADADADRDDDRQRKNRDVHQASDADPEVVCQVLERLAVHHLRLDGPGRKRLTPGAAEVTVRRGASSRTQGTWSNSKDALEDHERHVVVDGRIADERVNRGKDAGASLRGGDRCPG
jgi:hypothetical protein